MQRFLPIVCFPSGIEKCTVAVGFEGKYKREPLSFLKVHLELNTCHFLLSSISAALLQQEVVFRFDIWASEPTTIHLSLSQGSPLSPVLFTAYTVRITYMQIMGRERTFSYADDVLVYRQGRDWEQGAGEHQIEINSI